jgi:hypothetical protein
VRRRGKTRCKGKERGHSCRYYSVDIATAAAKIADKSTPLDELLRAAPVRMIVPFEFPFWSIENPASPSVPKLCTPCFRFANPTAVGLDWNTVYTFLRKALPTKQDVSEQCRNTEEFAHRSKSVPALMFRELAVSQM